MGLCDLLRNGTKCRFHYLKITQGKNDFFLNLILKNVYIFLWFGNSKTPDNNSVENIHKKKKPNKNWAEQWLQYFLRNINKEENERFRQSKFSLTEIIVYFDFKLSWKLLFSPVLTASKRASADAPPDHDIGSANNYIQLL